MSINNCVGDIKQYRMVSEQASTFILTPFPNKLSFPFLGSVLPQLITVFVWAGQNMSK